MSLHMHATDYQALMPAQYRRHSRNPRSWRRARFTARALLIALVCFSSARQAAAEISYNSDVRPILAKRCFECHGPDEHAREAELRLDLPLPPDRRTADEGLPIVPGNAQQSVAYQRIISRDDDERMPPSHKEPLSAAEAEVIRKWIDEGAAYQQHWAFVPPVQPAVPEVTDYSWARSPHEFFLLAAGAAAGLYTSKAATAATLVRRVYLDLIGLPPLPEEVHRFLRDMEATSLDAAYQKLIDDLMSRSQYGEHWARRWLDLARYADSNGYEKDRPRNMWRYRDWVVGALNDDMPFDQFTVEQIAGDMLPDATLEQRIATGFHRNTMLNEEGGIDPLEYRFHAMTDRVATTGASWLGLTLGRPQCNTQKSRRSQTSSIDGPTASKSAAKRVNQRESPQPPEQILSPGSPTCEHDSAGGRRCSPGRRHRISRCSQS